MAKKGALVLAAGKGTRMPSPRPKVLNTVLDMPMVSHVCRALKPVFGNDVFVLIGHMADMVRETLAGENVHFVLQEEQLGTAHALKTAMPDLLAEGCTHVLVINGDTPLLSKELIETFLLESEDADLAFASIQLSDPGAYGRVVRHNGRVAAIVEAKDYDPAMYGPVSGEVNAGLYLISLPLAQELLPRIDCANKNGEYYITDLVRLAVEGKFNVLGIPTPHENALLGVNTPSELAFCESILRFNIVQELLRSGVIIHAPEMVRVGPDARVAPGVSLNGPCEIYGVSVIGKGVSIDSHCVLRDAEIAENARINSFCHIERAKVGPGAKVGPFANLRPGAVLEND